MIVPRVYLKIAYGSFQSEVSINVNWNVGRMKKHLKDEIRNCFRIEPGEKIEIVLDRGNPYSELGEKVPTSPLSAYTFLQREVPDTVNNGTQCGFYARIIRKVGDTEYIKTDTNIITNERTISYIKKDELDEIRRGIRFNGVTVLTSADMDLLTTHNPPPVAPPTPEICSICTENPVDPEHRYNCLHLFCNTCFGNWPQTCALCREPIQ